MCYNATDSEKESEMVYKKYFTESEVELNEVEILLRQTIFHLSQK